MKPVFTPSSPYMSFLPTLKDSASPSKRTSVSSFQSTVDSDSAVFHQPERGAGQRELPYQEALQVPHVPPHPVDQKGRRSHHLESEHRLESWAADLIRPVLLLPLSPWLRGFAVVLVHPFHFSHTSFSTCFFSFLVGSSSFHFLLPPLVPPHPA